MRSNLRKNRVMTQPKEPEFLRVITHSEHILQGKLAIPRKFMMEYGSALSGSVLLKVPSGMTWKVALIKSDDDTLFGRGWEEFVRYHGIAYGHAILFQYEGGCSFRAFIFNMTATEIMYPCGSMNTAGDEEDDEEEDDEDDDDDPDFANKYSQSRMRKCGVPNRCYRPKKRTDIKAGMDWKLPKVKVEDQEGEECKPSNHKTTSEQTRVVENRKKTLTIEEKGIALRRAAAFESPNPFFKIVMQPSYILKAYLPIPAKFCKLHLGKQCASAVVSCPSGNSCPIRFCNSKYDTRITAGCAKFINDNGLEIGDVCVFELIKATKTSFKLVVFRATEDPQLS